MLKKKDQEVFKKLRMQLNNEAVAKTVIEAVVDEIPLKEAPVISQKVDIEGKAVIESIANI